MGGNGASSGMSSKGKEYGTEYTTLAEFENIKFIKYNDGSAKTPMETMTKNRFYGVINDQGAIKSMVIFDTNKKRSKQIDLEGVPHKVNGISTLPHTHLGYYHDELGTRGLTTKEMKLVVKAVSYWYNRGKK